MTNRTPYLALAGLAAFSVAAPLAFAMLSPAARFWFFAGLAIYGWVWLCRRFRFFAWFTFGFLFGLLSGGRSGHSEDYDSWYDDNDY